MQKSCFCFFVPFVSVLKRWKSVSWGNPFNSFPWGCDPWWDFMWDCTQKYSIDLSERHCCSLPPIFVYCILKSWGEIRNTASTQWTRFYLNPVVLGAVSSSFYVRKWILAVGEDVLFYLNSVKNGSLSKRITTLFWNRCFQSFVNKIRLKILWIRLPFIIHPELMVTSHSMFPRSEI